MHSNAAPTAGHVHIIPHMVVSTDLAEYMTIKTALLKLDNIRMESSGINPVPTSATGVINLYWCLIEQWATGAEFKAWSVKTTNNIKILKP